MKAKISNLVSVSDYLLTLMDKPNREVFYYEDRIITSSQFNYQVENLVAFLQNTCYKRSVIFCDNSFFFAVAFFASIKAGLSIVMPQNNRPGYLDKLLLDDDVLLYDNSILELSARTKKQSHLIAFLDVPQSGSLLPLEKATKSVAYDMKIIFFTSGSMGEPKQIEKKISHLEEELKILDALWGVKVGDSVFVSSVSHQHIYGLLFRLLWPLLRGNLIHCTSLLSLEELVAVNNAFSKKTFITSPAFLKRLFKENIKNVFSGFLSLISSGGELVQKYSQFASGTFGLSITEVLGSTETGGIAYRTSDSEAYVPVWNLFPGVSVKIVPESGELLVKSLFVYKDDYVPTGDRIQLLGNDKFLLFERMDNIVKLEEKRVSIKGIEDTLLEHPFVQDSRGLVLQNYRQSLGMVIELTPEGKSFLLNKGKNSLNKLFRDYLKNKVDLIAIPRKWRYVYRMPINSSSKVSLLDLEELFED